MSTQRLRPAAWPSAYLSTLAAGAAVLAAVGAAALAGSMTVPEMTRDVAALAGVHPLAGVLSNLGLVLWSAAAAICLFGAALLDGPDGRFLFYGGLLSGYVLIDDFFQVHEVLAPQYLGVRERYVYLGLLVGLLAWLACFRNVIARTRWPMLVLALGCFGLSTSLDAAVALLLPPQSVTPAWEFFVEDGAKWLGICCWCSYLAGAAASLLRTRRG